MAQLVCPPKRFTTEEWKLASRVKHHSAEQDREMADRIIAESDRLCSEVDSTVVKGQDDTTKKLEQRIGDINFWKDEIDQQLEKTGEEIDSLVAYKTRVEKSIEAVQEPLHIARQCLANREKRKDIDLVHDDTQQELIKEIEVYEGANALLQRTLEQLTEQIRLNRKARYHLEKDILGKQTAVDIDGYSKELKNHREDTFLNDGAVKIDKNSFTPEEWKDYTDDNIKKAERERNNGKELRSIADGILQQVANDQENQVVKTNRAFNRRIDETRKEKIKLEGQLKEVLVKIGDLEVNVEKLKTNIEEKMAPLRVAHTRLDARAARPGVELCRDPAQERMIQEVRDIEISIEKLQVMLKQSEDMLKALRRNQLELEDDLNVKTNSLYVDEVECMGMRKSILIEQY